MIKVGDRVKFISDTGSGKVVSVNGSTVEVDVVGGFVVPYMATELVVVSEEEEIDVIERIGVGDERPGNKKGNKQKDIPKTAVKKSKEPAYSRYGKISLVDDDYEEEFLDMNRIKEQYQRNRAAAAERERQFEEIRAREKAAAERVVESSNSVAPAEVKEEEKSVESELNDKIASDTVKAAAKPKEDKKAKNSDIEVVDLHAEEILESTAGMSNGDIINAQLARFTLSLNLAIGRGKRGKIIFIHGVGKGKLRREIDLILRRDYPKVSSQDASFKEYGYGAIMILY